MKDHVGPFTIFQQWRELLRESQYSSSSPPELDQSVEGLGHTHFLYLVMFSLFSRMDSYDRLIWEVWMPKFRQVLTTWSPKTQVTLQLLGITFSLSFYRLRILLIC